MSSKRTKDQHLVEKVNKLKEKQNQWMKEREDNKNQKKFVHSSLRSTSSSVKQSTQDVMKKSDTMAWATSNSNYNGFVVRNGSGTSRSRPDSSRTPSNKKTKTFTHSSLKKQTSSKPLSAKSSNFTHSNNKELSKEELVDNPDEEKNSTLESDESLSTSFTEHMTNLKLDQYDSTKYNNNKPQKKMEGIKYMDNHFCASCKQVMVTEDRKPVMVFPCGHSFCAKCLSGKRQCLQCGCDIISIQTNDSLFMIIQQFKRKTEKEELEMKEKQIRSYIDEYKNLNTRINIMRGEATDVIDQMEEATHQLIDKQNIIKHHEEYIQGVETEIASLRRAIQSEHECIEIEQQQIKHLERDYDKQKGQLNMLQKTIGSISENKEKLRDMVEKVAPHVVPILEEIDDDQ